MFSQYVQIFKSMEKNKSDTMKRSIFGFEILVILTKTKLCYMSKSALHSPFKEYFH